MTKILVKLYSHSVLYILGLKSSNFDHFFINSRSQVLDFDEYI